MQKCQSCPHAAHPGRACGGRVVDLAQSRSIACECAPVVVDELSELPEGALVQLRQRGAQRGRFSSRASGVSIAYVYVGLSLAARDALQRIVDEMSAEDFDTWQIANLGSFSPAKHLLHAWHAELKALLREPAVDADDDALIDQNADCQHYGKPYAPGQTHHHRFPRGLIDRSDEHTAE